MEREDVTVAWACGVFPTSLYLTSLILFYYVWTRRFTYARVRRASRVYVLRWFADMDGCCGAFYLAPVDACSSYSTCAPSLYMAFTHTLILPHTVHDRTTFARARLHTTVRYHFYVPRITGCGVCVLLRLRKTSVGAAHTIHSTDIMVNAGAGGRLLDMLFSCSRRQ